MTIENNEQSFRPYSIELIISRLSPGKCFFVGIQDEDRGPGLALERALNANLLLVRFARRFPR